MRTIVTQVSTCVREWRCLAASERTSASPPVACWSIRWVSRSPIHETRRANSTEPREISSTSSPRPESQVSRYSKALTAGASRKSVSWGGGTSSGGCSSQPSLRGAASERQTGSSGLHEQRLRGPADSPVGVEQDREALGRSRPAQDRGGVHAEPSGAGEAGERDGQVDV